MTIQEPVAVKIIGGELYLFLKDTTIVGAVSNWGDEEKFSVYGCIRGDEKKFYQGIFEYDKENPAFEFENAKEAEEFWLGELGHMPFVLRLDLKDIEILEQGATCKN